MSVLDELEAKFQKLSIGLDSFARKIVNSPKYKQILRDYNIANLEAGIRPDGSEIDKSPTGRQKNSGYEEQTIRKKEKSGARYDHVTLYDSGEFYAKLKVVSGSDTLYLIDTDSKTDKLITVWGDVIGITKEQRDEFMEILYADYQQFINENFYS